jgi:hypothetical protein
MDASLRPLTLRDLTLAPTIPTFIFVVGDDEYKCQLALAMAISNPIQEHVARRPDSPVRRFVFQNLKDPHRHFPQFIDLIQGGDIEIRFENAFFFHAIATQLQILPLVAATAPFVSVAPSLSNVIMLLRLLSEHGLPTDVAMQFIVRNWSRFENSADLLTLPVEALNDLFNSDSLEPTSELVLFDIICAAVRQRGREFVTLFHHVFLSKLDMHRIQQFIELISFDEIPECVLAILGERFSGDSGDEPPIAPTPEPYRPPLLLRTSAPVSSPPVKPQVSVFNKTAEFRFLERYDDEGIIDGVFSQFIRN